MQEEQENRQLFIFKLIIIILKLISEITNKNPDNFLERELEIRKKNKLPPFQRFISLILTGENEN